MSITDRVQLVKQVTIGDGVEQWGLKVAAPNKVLARQWARMYVRAVAPTTKNIVDPEIVGSAATEQSRLRQFFPETLENEEFEVEVIVVK